MGPQANAVLRRTGVLPPPGAPPPVPVPDCRARVRAFAETLRPGPLRDGLAALAESDTVRGGAAEKEREGDGGG